MAPEIKRGQRWEFVTNNGILVRDVLSVTRNGTVSYRNAGGNFCQCELTTFRKWTRGAQITFFPPEPLTVTQ